MRYSGIFLPFYMHTCKCEKQRGQKRSKTQHSRTEQASLITNPIHTTYLETILFSCLAAIHILLHVLQDNMGVSINQSVFKYWLV